MCRIIYTMRFRVDFAAGYQVKARYSISVEFQPLQVPKIPSQL